jgi:hypothetical protein
MDCILALVPVQNIVWILDGLKSLDLAYFDNSPPRPPMHQNLVSVNFEC